MACLLQLAPACSRVETFVGFGWETPRVFANPLTELTCHKSRRPIRMRKTRTGRAVAFFMAAGVARTACYVKSTVCHAA